jgi:hypothetical protein
MQPREHRPTDVVEDRAERELVAVTDAAQLRNSVRCPLHCEGVEAEPVGSEGEMFVPVEDVVGGRRAKDRLDGAWAESLDSVSDAADPFSSLQLTGSPHDGASEADIGLDHCGDLVRRDPAVDLLEGLIASLQQSGLTLGLVEGGGENSTTPLATRHAMRTPG